MTVAGPKTVALTIPGFKGYLGNARDRVVSVRDELAQARRVPDGEHPERYCFLKIWEVFQKYLVNPGPRALIVMDGGGWHAPGQNDIWTKDIVLEE
jgi:hypothetical protein